MIRELQVMLACACVLVAGACSAATTSGNAQFDKAFGYHSSGQLKEAIEAYASVVSDNLSADTVRRAAFGIASCNFSLKNYDEAVRAFLHYADSYPEDPDAPLSLTYAANCRMDQRKFDDAAELYKRALSSKQGQSLTLPWVGWANLGMGRYLVNVGKYKQSLPYLDLAIQAAQEPKTIVEAKLFKSEALDRTGAEDALSPLDDILTMSTSGPYTEAEREDWLSTAVECKGGILIRQGKMSQAIDFLSKTASDNPKHPVQPIAQHLIGLAMIEQGHVAEAKAHFAKLIAASPSEGEWKCDLAYCSYRERNWPVASTVLIEALKSGSTGKWRSRANYLLGECYTHLKNIPAAKQALTRVTTDYPDTDLAEQAARRLAQLQADKEVK